MSWYYQIENQEFGPFSKMQLQELIQSGQITGKTLVRNITMSVWRPLSELVRPGSAERGNPPEPPNPLPVAAPASQAPVAAGQSARFLDGEVPFQFNGTGSAYFNIWIVNALLSIVTFGIYSAWAKVRRKQFFYGNTSVAGAAFRYLADPVKILKGRLVVFAGFAGYSVISQVFPPAGALLIVGLFFLMPWLVVRSLAFNARNSSWRNIRFNFAGRYGGAAKVFILWPLLVPFTLGLLGPYVFYRQKKFMVENSSYGTTRFTFDATGRDYFAIAMRALVPIGIIAVLIGALVLSAGQYLAQLASFAPMVLFVAVAAAYLYAFAYVSVHFSNLLYNSGALLRHRFKASMVVNQYAFIVLTNTLATVLTLGLFHPFAQVRAYRYKIQHLSLLPGGDLDQFVAAEMKETSALGDELSDFMDFDFGL